MKVYITRANSMKILRKLDYSNLNIEGAVYSKPIFFLNKREEQALLAYKEFVMNPEKFIEEVYQRVEIIDNFRYVFEGESPCYHHREDCERLHSEFRNYEIPQTIRERGLDEVQRYRIWFKDNMYLLDGKKDILEMRIYAAFGVHVRAEEIIKDNSGIKTIENLDLNRLEERLNSLIKEAGRFYYKSFKHTKILKQYSKFAFLGTYNEPLYNNNTGLLEKYDKNVEQHYKDYIRTNEIWNNLKTKINYEVN